MVLLIPLSIQEVTLRAVLRARVLRDSPLKEAVREAEKATLRAEEERSPSCRESARCVGKTGGSTRMGATAGKSPGWTETKLIRRQRELKRAVELGWLLPAPEAHQRLRPRRRVRQPRPVSSKLKEAESARWPMA